MEQVFLIGWSAFLTAFIAVVGFVAREKNTKLKDLEQLLINTKLEVARDNVTNAEIDKIKD
jgi:thioredoxin-related protein